MTRGQIAKATMNSPLCWVAGPNTFVRVTLKEETTLVRKEAYAFLTFDIETLYESGAKGGPCYHFELFQCAPGEWQVIGTGEVYKGTTKMLRELAQRAVATDAAKRLGAGL